MKKSLLIAASLLLTPFALVQADAPDAAAMQREMMMENVEISVEYNTVVPAPATEPTMSVQFPEAYPTTNTRSAVDQDTLRSMVYGGGATVTTQNAQTQELSSLRQIMQQGSVVAPQNNARVIVTSTQNRSMQYGGVDISGNHLNGTMMQGGGVNSRYANRGVYSIGPVVVPEAKTVSVVETPRMMVQQDLGYVLGPDVVQTSAPQRGVELTQRIDAGAANRATFDLQPQYGVYEIGPDSIGTRVRTESMTMSMPYRVEFASDIEYRDALQQYRRVRALRIQNALQIAS